MKKLASQQITLVFFFKTVEHHPLTSESLIKDTEVDAF
jgi:hypothetical protein